MSRERSLVAWLVVAILLLWVIGLAVQCNKLWLVVGTAIVVICGIGLQIVMRRQLARGQNGMPPDLRSAVRSEVAAVARRLRRDGVASEPWILVVGAPWCGKSSALACAGAVPVEAPSPNVCRWWRSPRGIYIEMPSRWFVDSAAIHERQALLKALRRRRRCPGLAGTLFVVSLGELLSLDDSAVEASAQLIRTMQREIELALEARLPAWFLFMKSDLLGGFRDFSAGLRDEERRAPLGSLLAVDSPDAGIGPALRTLAEATRAQRLRVLRTASSDERFRNAYQFPRQFQIALRWVNNLAQKATADHDGAPLRLRGIHFASCTAGPEPSAGDGALGVRTRFFDTAEFHLGKHQSVQVAPESLFIRELISDLIPGEHRLAIPSVRRAKIRRWSWRILALLLPVGAGVFAIFLLAVACRVADLAYASRHALVTAREAVGRDPVNEITALEPLAARLASATGVWGGAPVRERLEREYYASLGRLLVGPCVSRLERDLRQQPSDGDADAGDRIAISLRAYRFLGGDVSVDLTDLEPFLVADSRWCAGLEDADARVREAAHRHLAFLLGHARSTRGWAVPVDRVLIQHVETLLADSLWVAQACRDLDEAAAGSFPAVRAKDLADGLGREQLELSGDVPGSFTQCAWDAMFVGAVRRRAESLCARLATFGISRRATDLEQLLVSRHCAEHRQHWLALLRGVRVAGMTDTHGIPLFLAACSGPRSAYRALVRSTLEGARLGGVHHDGPGITDWRWLDDVLQSLAGLGTDAARYLSATEPGHRTSDIAAIRELARAFDAAYARANSAAESIDDAIDRAVVLESVRGLLTSVLKVMVRDVLEEQERAWSDAVYRPFSSDLAGHYPFSSDATEDAAPAAVSRMFNPASGTFWRTASTIESLRALHALGVELMPVSSAYLEMLHRATVLRDGLYPDGRSCWSMRFRLTLCLREGTTDMRISAGDHTAGIYDHPDRSAEFSMDEGRCSNARVVLRTVTGQVLTCDALSGPWSIMRLIRQGAPIPRANGGWTCTWSTRADAVGHAAVFKGSAQLGSEGAAQVLAGDILTGMSCPAMIGAAQ